MDEIGKSEIWRSIGGGGGVRSGYYSESSGVATAKFAAMTWVKKNPPAALYVQHLSGDANYAAPRALFRVFKWLVKQPGWSSNNAMGEVEYVLWKQGSMSTDHKRAELENLLLDFCNQEIEGTKNYKLKFYNVLHGLMKYHMVQLPNSDISEIKADTPPVEANLSMDEIRRVVDACNLREKAIFSLIFQGIMDQERFTIVNRQWRVLEPQLKDGREWITFRFEYRKKNEHPYFTMWHRDGDAIRFLKGYLKERGTPELVGTDSSGHPIHEAIFLNRQKQPFNKDNLKHAWITAGTRAGVVERPRPTCNKCGLRMRKMRRYLKAKAGGEKRYECICGNIEPASQYLDQFRKYRSGKNLHEMRDTVKTIIPNMAGVDRTLVAFFSGHQIDPLDYEKLRDAEMYGLMKNIQERWSRALPYLNLWSQAGDLATSPTRVADLEDRLNKKGLEIMQLREQQKLIIAFLASQVTESADPAMQKLIDRIREEANTVTSLPKPTPHRSLTPSLEPPLDQFDPE